MKLSVLIVVVNECGRTAFVILVSEKYSDICAETVVTAFRVEIHRLIQNSPFFRNKNNKYFILKKKGNLKEKEPSTLQCYLKNWFILFGSSSLPLEVI